MSDSVAYLNSTEWSKYLPSDVASMVARSSTGTPFPGDCGVARSLVLSQEVVERVRGREVDLVPAVAVRPHRRAGGAELVQAGDAVQDEGLRVDPRRRVAAQPGAVGPALGRRVRPQERAQVRADVARSIPGRGLEP